MKVYSCPAEVPAPVLDFGTGKIDWNKMEEDEKSHQVRLKEWLKAKGWNGKHTGGIVRFGVADGHAVYMMADGPKSCLIHLPYGDGYQYLDVKFLPKKEIIKRMENQKELAKLFSCK
jgi:hypothetical protein